MLCAQSQLHLQKIVKSSFFVHSLPLADAEKEDMVFDSGGKDGNCSLGCDSRFGLAVHDSSGGNNDLPKRNTKVYTTRKEYKHVA